MKLKILKKNPSKTPLKAMKGDPCPNCGGHAFEILKTNARGEFVIKCLCCKQQLQGKWSIDECGRGR